jgi:hypothetical protein
VQRTDTQSGSRLKKQKSQAREERPSSSGVFNKLALKPNEAQPIKASNTLHSKAAAAEVKKVVSSAESKKVVSYQRSNGFPGSTKIRKYQNAPVEVSRVGELQVSMANSTNGQLLIRDLMKFNNYQKELDKIQIQT